MLKNLLLPDRIIHQERDNLWLFVPVFFGFGAALFINFETWFLEHLLVFFGVFFISAFCSYLFGESYKSLVFIAVTLFLCGGFYVNFYQKVFLNHTPITGKFYADGIGKVESINKFYNPINHLEGASVMLSHPTLYKADFSKKKLVIKKIKKKKVKKTKEKKKRKSQKQKAEELGLTLAQYKEMRVLEKIKKAEEKIKKEQEKQRKKELRRQQKIEKNFMNVAGFQEIDRKFLDFSKNYQYVKWLEIKGREQFPNPPQKILINFSKYQGGLTVNDVIAVRMSLHPPERAEFPDDFDPIINSKANKIAAYGFAFGEIKILKKAEISSLDGFFIELRQKAKDKILAILDGDIGAIALALLIGDQKQISPQMMDDIRSSGLAHLLSISGFHLSLMATIFLATIRFILSRSEYLALNFNLKKIAAFFALIATYFYLKIADSPLPAQRSFLMVAFVLLAIFLSEKINAKRVVMASAFLMILANPFSLLNIGFQLSYIAIIVLGAFYDYFSKLNNEEERGFFAKIFWYFLVIILTSIAIQIATTPLLMRSFQNVSILGFLANITAIPLASFFVMPLGFLALFLMFFGLEKLPLLLMKSGIIGIEKISTFIAELKYSHLISPQLSSIGIVLAIIGILLFCLTSSRIRYLGIVFFLSSFLTLSFAKKPILAFQKDQRFFIIDDEKDGFIFSKKLHDSKQRKLWMKRFNIENFKSLEDFSAAEKQQKGIFCDEKKCEIEKENQKFLILFKRNKLSEICENDFDVIVNFSRKYTLPECITTDKIKIDNSDFYQKGVQFFYKK